MSCPSDEAMARFVEGELGGDEHRALADHLRECDSCAAAISIADGLSRSAVDPPAPDPIAFDKGTAVGRFVVVAQIGRGAMGQVYSAYDPALDRKVALKFLHAAAPGHLEGPRAVRLFREARALATIVHPNVVTVHDLGVFDGHPYVAMEYVEGGTLRTWLRAAPRKKAEIIAAYRAAAAGLFAAHARDMVHRDFKPDNVLVGSDGRVCVTDFGLVRWAAGAPTVHSETRADGDVDLDEETRTGTLLGTPAYMAPEQLRGDVASAHSDQFALCVALWEALAGKRPFTGRSVGELLEAMRRAPQSAAGIPRWLAPVLTRGLAYDPSERHSSMEVLILRLSPRSHRWVWLATGGATLAAASSVAFAGEDALQQSHETLCAVSAEQASTVWGSAERAALTTALTSSGAVYSKRVAQAVVAALDDYAEQWSTAVTVQCEAQGKADVPDTKSAVRMLCLQRRLDDLGAMAATLTDTGAKSLHRAVAAVGRLPSIEACSTDAGVAAFVGLEDPLVPQDLVQSIGPLVSQAIALGGAGEFERAEGMAQEAVSLASRSGHQGVLADAQHVLGFVQRERGALRKADRSLADAVEAAVAADAKRIVVSALEARAIVLNQLHEPARAQDLLDLAEAHLDAIGDDDLLRLRLIEGRAALAQARGDFAAADAGYEHTLALRLARDSRPIDLITNLTNAGTLALVVGQTERGLARLERAEEMVIEQYGVLHPRVVDLRLLRVNAELARGADAGTTALVKTTLDDAIEAVGERNPLVPSLLTQQARVAMQVGDTDTALASVERALALTALDPDHPHTADKQSTLAEVLRMRGEYDRAEAVLADAIASLSKDGSGPALAELLEVRADVAHDRGRDDAALADMNRAVALSIEAFGKDSPWVATTQAVRALRRLDTGDVDGGLNEIDLVVQVLLAARADGALGDGLAGRYFARLAHGVALHRPQDPRVARLAGMARGWLRDAPPPAMQVNEATRWLFDR